MMIVNYTTSDLLRKAIMILNKPTVNRSFLSMSISQHPIKSVSMDFMDFSQMVDILEAKAFKDKLGFYFLKAGLP